MCILHLSIYRVVWIASSIPHFTMGDHVCASIHFERFVHLFELDFMI